MEIGSCRSEEVVSTATSAVTLYGWQTETDGGLCLLRITTTARDRDYRRASVEWDKQLHITADEQTDSATLVEGRREWKPPSALC